MKRKMHHKIKEKQKANSSSNLATSDTHWLINSKGQAMCVKKILVTSELPLLSSNTTEEVQKFIDGLERSLKLSNVPKNEWVRLGVARVMNNCPSTHLQTHFTWENFTGRLLNWSLNSNRTREEELEDEGISSIGERCKKRRRTEEGVTQTLVETGEIASAGFSRKESEEVSNQHKGGKMGCTDVGKNNTSKLSKGNTGKILLKPVKKVSGKESNFQPNNTQTLGKISKRKKKKKPFMLWRPAKQVSKPTLSSSLIDSIEKNDSVSFFRRGSNVEGEEETKLKVEVKPQYCNQSQEDEMLKPDIREKVSSSHPHVIDLIDISEG